jgi:hypothetical protein
MKNLLDEAVGALRDEGASDEASHRFTRARVMASLHQHTVKRRTYLAFVLPIAATFIATSAWGVSSGRARVWIEEIRTVFGISKGEEAAPAPKPATPKRVARATEPTPPSELREAPPVPPPVEEPEKSPSGDFATSQVTPLAPPSAFAAPDAGLDAELELYRTAHRAHFIEQNSRAALAAWDAYLAKAPRGKFALEARYNRALCLVRLDRKADARAALEPFARGAFGAYRKREATELLDALDR